VKTDLPLKRLTQLRPADLLHLLGSPEAEVVAVETLELPASTTSLDTVLRLRLPDGPEYLHLIEWQGYHDPQFLWRTLGYLSWLGQNRRERPILVTIIYLHPGDDIGDTLVQEVPGVQKWLIGLPCIRLWQHNAGEALARRIPGLAALSPLMDYATPERVEEAAEIILQGTSPLEQDELITVLGIFAEGLLSPERLERLITRERIMTSSFIRHVFREEIAEREASLRQETVSTLIAQAEETAILRFPNLPAHLAFNIRELADVATLRQLHRDLLTAPDQAAAEQILAALAER